MEPPGQFLGCEFFAGEILFNQAVIRLRRRLNNRLLRGINRVLQVFRNVRARQNGVLGAQVRGGQKDRNALAPIRILDARDGVKETGILLVKPGNHNATGQSQLIATLPRPLGSHLNAGSCVDNDQSRIRRPARRDNLPIEVNKPGGIDKSDLGFHAAGRLVDAGKRLAPDGLLPILLFRVEIAQT